MPFVFVFVNPVSRKGPADLRSAFECTRPRPGYRAPTCCAPKWVGTVEGYLIYLEVSDNIWYMEIDISWINMISWWISDYRIKNNISWYTWQNNATCVQTVHHMCIIQNWEATLIFKAKAHEELHQLCRHSVIRLGVAAASNKIELKWFTDTKSRVFQSYLTWWLSHPSERFESQLGWWLSQSMEKHMFQTTNQINRDTTRMRNHPPVITIFISCKNQQLNSWMVYYENYVEPTDLYKFYTPITSFKTVINQFFRPQPLRQPWVARPGRSREPGDTLRSPKFSQLSNGNIYNGYI